MRIYRGERDYNNQDDHQDAEYLHDEKAGLHAQAASKEMVYEMTTSRSISL